MTRAQQKKMNAMCGDLAEQVRLAGNGQYIHREQGPGIQQLDKDSWRWIFCGTYKGWKTVPAIEGNGFVMLGASSRNLTVEECGEVMEMIAAFGAERGVVFRDPSEIQEAA